MQDKSRVFPAFFSDYLPVLLLATPGIGATLDWFGFTLNTATTFDVFRRLEVTNNGFFDILFESAPERSNLIGVRVFCTHVSNGLPPIYAVATF
jgi:hypothetical protein